MAIDEKAEAMEATQDILAVWSSIEKDTGATVFDTGLRKRLKLLDAGPKGTCVFELKVPDAYGNLNGVMHGGAAGMIFDTCTTLALAPLKGSGQWGPEGRGGVSRTLNVSYLKAIPLGTTVHIHSWVVHVGRTMALLRGTIESPDRSQVYCAAEHHKVNLAARI